MFSPIFFIFLSCFTTIIKSDPFSDPNYQTFEIYDNLTTLSHKFDGNLRDLEKEWIPIISASRWCSQRQGLWLFYSGLNFSTESNYYGFIKTPRAEHPSANCANLEEVINGSLSPNEIRSIRRMTHANLSVPAISLFSAKGSVLHQELFLDSHALSLPEPMVFHAYGFSGFESWTLFSETNFTGVSTCLLLPLDYNEKENDPLALLSFGVPFSSFKVGSLRDKCSGYEDFFQYPVNTSLTILNIRNLHLAPSVMPYLIANPNANSSLVWPESDEEFENRRSIKLETIYSNGTSQGVLFYSGIELVLPEPLIVTEYFDVRADCDGEKGANLSERWAKWGLWSDLDFTGSLHLIDTKENASNVFDPPILVMSINVSCFSEIGPCRNWSASSPSSSLSSPPFALWLSSHLFVFYIMRIE